MANTSTPLLETLAKKRKKNASGTLTRDAEGQLRERTTAGAAPLTPLGAKMQGVSSPDVAKMVGDARQKRAALQEQADPSKQLSTQMRQRQAGREMERDQQAVERAERLDKFGADVGARVNTIVESKLAEATLDADQFVTIADDVPEEAKSALEAYRADKNPNTLAAAANALGLDPSTDAAALEEQIEGKFVTDVGAATAAAFGDFEIGNVLSEMGYDEAALTELGISGEITSMEDLEKELDRIEREEYSKVKETQGKAFDPDASANERGEALQSLRDMGAVGVRSLEEQMEEIGQAFDEGAQLTFAGQSYNVEEFFEDSAVTELARDFFENPETAELLKEQEPEFAAFLENNAQALEGALENVVPDDAAEELVEVQKTNAEVKGELSTALTGLPDDVQKSILDFAMPGHDSGFTGEPIDTSKVAAFVDNIKADPTFAGNFNAMITDNPKLAKRVMSLDKSQWKKLGFPKPGGDLTKIVKTWKKGQKDHRKIRDAAKTPEGAVKWFLRNMKDGSVPFDINNLDKLVAREKAAYAATGKKSEIYDLLTAKDPAKAIQKFVQDNNERQSFADFADEGGKKRPWPKQPGKGSGGMYDKDEYNWHTQKWVTSALADGKLDKKEISKANGAALHDLLYKMKGPAAKKNAKAIKKQLAKLKVENTEKALRDSGARDPSANPDDVLAALKKKMEANKDRHPGNAYDQNKLFELWDYWSGEKKKRGGSEPKKKKKGETDKWGKTKETLARSDPLKGKLY